MRFQLAMCSFLLVVAAFAQSDRGTITGTVSDPAKALVPDAAVVAMNAETGAQYETVTTGTGNYTLPSLPAGVYNLSVSAAGFSKYVQQGIRVEVVQTARVDVSLQVGSAADSVTVTADAPLLKSESAEQSLNLSTDIVNALPANSNSGNMRSAMAFGTLTPGAVGDPVAAGSTFRVNGSPGGMQRVLVDGQDVTSALFSDATQTSYQRPAVEALSEFTLQTSNFAAEFGQVNGGLFNFTSKSGTNQLHGSAFYYLRNEFLNAGQPYTHVDPKARRRNWGFTVGGPVYIPKVYNGRDKTFFFVNLDWFTNNSATDTFSTVPTAKMRTGDFSEALTGRSLGTNPAGGSIMENMIFDPLTNQTVNGQVTRSPFPGNAIPQTRLDPVALKIQAMLPQPTRSGVLLNWEQKYLLPTTQNIPSFKIDQNVGYKAKFTFYWGDTRYIYLARGDGLAEPITGTRNRHMVAQTARLNHDYSVTPTFLIHAGFGYVHDVHNDGYMPGTLNYDPLSGLGLAGNFTPGMPLFNGLSSSSGGGMVSQYGLGMGKFTSDINDKPTAVLSATLVRGNHTYKAGGEWRNDPMIYKDVTSAPTYSFSANETALPYLQTTNIGGGAIGLPYASFLLGLADSASISALSAPENRKNSWGFYVQDTWKVSRNLTLDYGLRWDYQQAAYEMNYRNGMFGPTVPNPSAGGLLGGMVYEGYGTGRCNCRFTNTYPYAFGPRLGVAYKINPKTVVRGGWGLVYGGTPTGGETVAQGVGWNSLSFSSTSFGNPGAVLRTGLIYNLTDLYSVSLNPGLLPQAGTITSPPYYQDRNGGRPPRINQWNIGVQRELFTNLVLETAYVGNRGVWLTGDNLLDFNALTPQRIASFGLNINNAADRTLLTSTMSSATAAARGFNKLPYAGFPATLTVAQSLRPYPQFGTIPVHYAPLGNTWYDGLQSKLTKRYSHGLVLSGAFTWSKSQTLGAESATGGGIINDVFNRQNQKALSVSDQPFVLVTTFSYRVPGLGPNRLVRQVVGDWTLSGVLIYASGSLIQVPAAQNNLSSLLFRSTFSNRVPGQPLFLKDINGPIDPNKDFVLNPAAWSDPAAGQWGFSAPYYSDYRNRRSPNEQLSFGRMFRLRERMTLEFRAEFFNVFNRLLLPGITSTNALATQTRNAAGVPTSGFGYMNSNSAGGQRNGQLLARFQF